MADPGEDPGGQSSKLFLDENGARSFVIMHIHKQEDVIDIDGIITEFARLKGTRLALSFGSKNKGGGAVNYNCLWCTVSCLS